MRPLRLVLVSSLVGALAVNVGILLGTALRWVDDYQQAARYTAKTAVYIVKPGDTLWGITEQYAHLDQQASCFEEFYTRVRKANKGAYLQPGQRVNIPYFEAK